MGRGQREVPMHNGPVIECAQCGGAIVAPEWSERCVRNVWSCETCGYQFEHTVYFSAPKIHEGAA
jgi:ribosomal protein L37AE/L43A